MTITRTIESTGTDSVRLGARAENPSDTSGRSVLKVAEDLMALYREGRYLEAIDELYAGDVVSMEAEPPPGGERVGRGKVAVRDRHTAWLERHDLHNFRIEGPYLDGANRFAVRMWFDMTDKASGERKMFDEVALYEMRAGKIVSESFFY